MKKALLLLITLIAFRETKAQYLSNDSLQGFDLAKTALEGHQKNFENAELKLYISNAKKNFIINKYKLYQNIPLQTTVSKYSVNNTANTPCVNEDFETSPTGTLATSFGGWSAKQGNLYSSICSPSPVAMSNNSTAITVYNTPVADPIIGFVPGSPFGGSKVVKINSFGLQIARISHTFPVVSSNWLFNYAYMGVLSQYTHGCCDDPYLMFRFFDCLGNPISSLSQTIVAGTPSCVATSTANWSVSTASLAGFLTYYTPNWQIVSKDLSAYTGTCLTVEVTASSCYSGAHPGYMYFDAICSGGNAMIINESVYQSPASSYTSCITQTTLSSLPGFSSYYWQGPPASGVLGLTSPAITTSVSGNYTLTATLGTIVATQVLNLTVVQGLTINILGSSTVCAAHNTTLQASGAGATSYSWSTNSNLQTITINPTTTAIYSVVASNTAGCLSSDSKTISVLQSPLIGIASSPATICQGQNSNLTVIPPTAYSYTWSNGALGSSVLVSPSVSSNYTVTGINSVGCVRTLSVLVTVLPSAQLSVSLSSSTLCLGKSVAMSASGLSGNTYSWSTGSSSSSISISPSITSVYTVTATTSLNCAETISLTITVHTLPQIQLIGSNTEICIGESVNFGVLGSNIGSVLWNTGASTASIIVSPTLNSVYSVTVSSAVGCVSEKSISMNVNPLPQVQIVASSSSICAGESATLTVNNASVTTYNWSNNQNGASIVVSPSSSSQYSVVVTDQKGCVNNTTFQLVVITCADTLTGIESIENNFNKHQLIIFPNPSDGSFEIQGSKTEKGTLINELGQVIAEFYLSSENNYTFKITNLAKGVYFVKSENSTTKIVVK